MRARVVQVYNVTPYFSYHPGGVDELMRGVGGDATALFDEIHKWVNIDFMLAKAYIGDLQHDLPAPLVSQASHDSIPADAATAGAAAGAVAAEATVMPADAWTPVTVMSISSACAADNMFLIKFALPSGVVLVRVPY